MATQTPHNQTVDRAPIIAVMGHVDHGKSTLLDYIRKTNIVEQEAGGITQHLSAYEVEHTTKEGVAKKITFLDTPGHAAFSEMRSRGATVADIAILVVSAEDGVQAQTKEALSQIKDARIPFVIAITKIDKPNANVERAKQSLLENEIYIEGYGGDIPCVPISAKSGQGVDDLMDMVLLAAELEELKGDPGIPAEGVVIESHVDPKKGTSATLIIKNGTLKKGEFVVAEDSFSPVRAVENFLGKLVDEASLSAPVRITGFNKVPAVGARFTTCTKKKDAESLTMQFSEGSAQASTQGTTSIPTQDTETITVPIMVKADTVGTLEAIEGEISRLTLPHATIQIIHSGVGDISENDVKLISGAESPIVIGFNVKVDKRAQQIIERLEATTQLFDIIYKITEWLTEEAERRIPKEMKQEIQGHATILRIFGGQKNKQVVGGKVVDGVISNKTEFKIMRRNNEVGTGKIIELQQQKAAADQVAEGKEFGAMVDARLELAEGDTIETFIIPE